MWRRYLGTTAQPVAKFARVEVMAMPTDPTPARSPPPQAAPTSGVMSHPDGMIGITPPDGMMVRVDAQVDSGALRRVLAALARR
jgi:hypothetical protein